MTNLEDGKFHFPLHLVPVYTRFIFLTIAADSMLLILYKGKKGSMC
jgi:hypothetical protein